MDVYIYMYEHVYVKKYSWALCFGFIAYEQSLFFSSGIFQKLCENGKITLDESEVILV